MKSFCLDMVKNPEIFKDNVLPARGDFKAFATDDELEEGVSSLRISLNGMWKQCGGRPLPSLQVAH